VYLWREPLSLAKNGTLTPEKKHWLVVMVLARVVKNFLLGFYLSMSPRLICVLCRMFMCT
jgi:hypothetical protein